MMKKSTKSNTHKSIDSFSIEELQKALARKQLQQSKTTKRTHKSIIVKKVKTIIKKTKKEKVVIPEKVAIPEEIDPAIYLKEFFESTKRKYRKAPKQKKKTLFI
jgi:isochorismate synthase EntC